MMHERTAKDVPRCDAIENGPGTGTHVNHKAMHGKYSTHFSLDGSRLRESWSLMALGKSMNDTDVL